MKYFELNRTSKWLWYYNLKPRDQTEFGIGLLNAFASIPQFGACAHLGYCTIEQYEQDRGQWTTKVHLGTTKVSQEAIHSASELAVHILIALIVDRQNEIPIFYSFFSNNCQHFIVDLCDYLEVAFSGNTLSLDHQFQHQQLPSSSESVVESALHEIPALGTSGATTIQWLWIKSRLILFLTSLLHFGLSVIPPFAVVGFARMFQGDDAISTEETGVLVDIIAASSNDLVLASQATDTIVPAESR